MIKTLSIILLIISVNYAVPDSAIDFSVKDIDGVEHHLFNYLDNGDYVLLKFTTPYG
jgi:hypothetical protein